MLLQAISVLLHLSPAQVSGVSTTGSILSDAAVIDLGYAKYQGYVDSSNGLEAYLGIRFAAPPARWQAPSDPEDDNERVISAKEYGSECVQSRPSAGIPQPELKTIPGSEDCLFLNVWKPANCLAALPVILWIHGGGYGNGNGRSDPIYLRKNTGRDFVFVSIQYRMGAFGFLASGEVWKHGVLNAGLLDQQQALKWVQRHIAKFCGDPRKVTLFGESAGAGSIIHHVLAYGGTLGNSQFQQAILASPYLPKQDHFAGRQSEHYYNMFLNQVKCISFECLVNAKSEHLALASDIISRQAFPGTFAFAPVEDGLYIQGSPADHLRQMQMMKNGRSVMVGSNSAEGSIFRPPWVNDSTNFESYLKQYLPMFSESELDQLKILYPPPELSNGLYQTHADRAALIYGESTFNCPGDWIADAFHTSYRYEYAVPTPLHGLDVPYYLPSSSLRYPDVNLPFARLFTTALVSFAIDGIPDVSQGISKTSPVPLTSFKFPRWNEVPHGQQVVFNVTGGTMVPVTIMEVIPTGIMIGGTPSMLLNDGRKMTATMNRCRFWRDHAPEM